jgi:hypothetical protein
MDSVVLWALLPAQGQEAVHHGLVYRVLPLFIRRIFRAHDHVDLVLVHRVPDEFTSRELHDSIIPCESEKLH